MTRIVLIHGAGGSAWDWHLVAGELLRAGHEVVAPDLPSDDDTAGLADYADAVVRAVPDDAEGAVVVAHSMGALTAPMVCDRLRVRQLVLLAPMIPAPGESAGDWWAATGQAEAQRDQARRDRAEGGGWSVEGGVEEIFLHDVDPELAAEALRRSRDQSGTPFGEPWPMTAWPAVRTRVLACRDDRLFPPPFVRRLARERLGVDTDVVPGGHYAAVSRPADVAARLVQYAAED